MDIKRNFVIIAYFLLFLFFQYPAYAQTLYWTGDGGKGIKVTVSEPKGIGLSAQEQSLLPLIQSTIIGTFQRYSAMTVMDQLNLENILRQQRQSMSGNFSDNDYIRIGNLTNARLVVFGSITKTTTSYTLELAITDVETGERKASYLPRQVSILALENLSAIREASADLLRLLGINLTGNALQELKRAEDTARVQAENALARGIAAQRQGTVVEALSYYFQAVAFNPSLSDAINRVSVVSATMSSGNLGQDVRNRLQVHDEWRTVVTTAQSFYANHLPYELVYSTNINRGTIDFVRRTTDLSIDLRLIPTDAWKTINNVRQGLARARQQNETWNFNLNQIEPRRIVIIIEIVNENNIVLSRASHTFINPSEKEQENATLNFRNVRADDLTNQLTVRVVSINEIPAQRAGETGYIQISSVFAYNERLAQIRSVEEAARREREEIAQREWEASRPEREIAEEAARRKRETEIRKQEFENWIKGDAIDIRIFLGYVYTPNLPGGFLIGVTFKRFGGYMSFSMGLPKEYPSIDNSTNPIKTKEEPFTDMLYGLYIRPINNFYIDGGIGFVNNNVSGLFNVIEHDEPVWCKLNTIGSVHFAFQIGLLYSFNNFYLNAGYKQYLNNEKVHTFYIGGGISASELRNRLD